MQETQTKGSLTHLSNRDQNKIQTHYSHKSIDISVTREDHSTIQLHPQNQVQP